MNEPNDRSPLLTESVLEHPLKNDSEELGRYESDNEQKLGDTYVGERLPYNDYSSIDFLHDLVSWFRQHDLPSLTSRQAKDSVRLRSIRNRPGPRYKLQSLFDEASGWIAAALIGTLTAGVAFLVDVAQASVSDWKLGYCSSNPLWSRKSCCEGKTPLLSTKTADLRGEIDIVCDDFVFWANAYSTTFAVYAAFALLFGILASAVTSLTRRSLPTAAQSSDGKDLNDGSVSSVAQGKVMFMAAGSGIPEIKTILSGFVIPGFLDLKVLVVKAAGAVFAVSTGMCLGKEGPFVHISTCVGYIVASFFPKYRRNSRKMREMLSAACASGLSVAFGAPIGGVLFSYEEISTFFPRKVLLRAFLCSLSAAVVLKALNPTGTGKLVLFETNYNTRYEPVHYLVFVLLGVAGGIFGGLFCRLNFLWSKWFRSFWFIKEYPVFEVTLIVLVTTLLQFPSPLIRETGDEVIKNLFVNCDNGAGDTWICRMEAEQGSGYKSWLVFGVLTKLVLTIITFGVKVPSGVIIPALDGGALFGRLVGQWMSISPGIFAMVGAAAFLAGVSRMTISLAVIMFELTGELEYIGPPNMVAILVAKWIADAIGNEGVYDVAQTVLGHPFLDLESSMLVVQRQDLLVEELIPPQQTMDEITVLVPASNKVPKKMLETKRRQLRNRGLLDAGLVLVNNEDIVQGYLAQGELEFALDHAASQAQSDDGEVQVLGQAGEGKIDISHFVDRTPLTIPAKAPLEYALEMFAKLGLRYCIITEDGSGKLAGVVIRKRLVAFLDRIRQD